MEAARGMKSGMLEQRTTQRFYGQEDQLVPARQIRSLSGSTCLLLSLSLAPSGRSRTGPPSTTTRQRHSNSHKPKHGGSPADELGSTRHHHPHQETVMQDGSGVSRHVQPQACQHQHQKPGQASRHGRCSRGSSQDNSSPLVKPGRWGHRQH